MGILDKVNARVENVIAKAEPVDAPASDDAGGEATVADVIEEVSADLPDPEAPAIAEPEVPAAPPPPPDKRAILEAKLADAREANRARREAREVREAARAEIARAQAYREQAERAAQAAEAERRKYEGLREGSFKEVLTTLGRDPRKTFEEMQREAAEAGTPEGQIRRLEQSIDERFASMVDPLKKKIEELEAERAAMSEREVAARFQADFSRNIVQPGYELLREAYEDEAILAYADNLRSNPQKMVGLARQYGIRLTNPQRGFFMREILEVLKAVQADYDSQRSARRERLRGPKQAAPRVNGTTGTKTSAGTIDNDLASARVSNGSSKLSRQDRIQREIDRLENR